MLYFQTVQSKINISFYAETIVQYLWQTNPQTSVCAHAWLSVCLCEYCLASSTEVKSINISFN